MATVESPTDRVICHCLRIRESEIRETIEAGAADSVRAIMKCTGAGSGCTACHYRIKTLLREAEGDQCPSASSSPTWVTR